MLGGRWGEGCDSQTGRDLGSSFGQLAEIQVQGEVSLQAEQLGAFFLLEDGLFLQVTIPTVEQQQVPVQIPAQQHKGTLDILIIIIPIHNTEEHWI